MRVYASARLTFPEFNKTCFVKVNRANIYDEPKQTSSSGNDKKITDRFLEYLNSRDKTRPYFAFVFYDASHGGYDYPAGFDKFRPAAMLR